MRTNASHRKADKPGRARLHNAQRKTSRRGCWTDPHFEKGCGSALHGLAVPDPMGVARSGMVAIAPRRIAFVHEVLRLGDDRQIPVNEGRQSPLRRNGCFAVPKNALRRWAEGRHVLRQRRAHIPKEVGPLRKSTAAIAIGRPVLVGQRAVHDFLQAQDIGAAPRQDRAAGRHTACRPIHSDT